MVNKRERNWREYKSKFLRANRCTGDEFEAAYIGFIEAKPSIREYYDFARAFGIAIIADPIIDQETQVILSVNIAAIKVMSQTFEEAEAAIRQILKATSPQGKR